MSNTIIPVIASRNRAGALAGTDWTADANLRGLYLFDSTPGFDQDSSGNNTHIDGGGNLPGSDTTNQIDGESGTFSQPGPNHDHMYEALANLTNFPGAGASDSNATWAGWAWIDNIADESVIFSHDNGTTTSLSLSVNGSGFFDVKFTDDTPDKFSFTTSGTVTATATEWMFVGITWNAGDNGDVEFYVRKQGEGARRSTNASTEIGEWGGVVNLEDCSTSGNFHFGHWTTDSAHPDSLTGNLDQWAVFNGVSLTLDDLDGVFDNSWNGDGDWTTP